ncbi:bifunctional folylpolyglutamate synthase/dihydrofolate synthase [Bacillus rubiinfantis]|uniref:bifunctional folylpolyglutamate synthase/dihydrofolate synthase n=1 Tax=Bacillus rubiinfantis TaxID=1499680 RepID=UPI0005AABCCC|nr:folylpolyglutamate synthase/dihydrofolate synthase family protein [Bacillus rubiinfantis]
MDEKLATAMKCILSRKRFGSRPGLFRIEYILKELRNPQDEINIVHIAGTNGKGSTAAYLTELFINTGLTVGTYTSPAIERFNERICINGCHIPNEDIIYLVERLEPIVTEMDKNPVLSGLTEFEYVTAMMYGYFQAKKVDVAIIETGLGGLMDSTNVGHPIVSGITTIGLDHMQILGNSIEKIAQQKAGIIKENSLIVTGNIPENAMRVIEVKASSLGAQIYRYNQEYFPRHIVTKPLEGECFSFNNDIYYFPFLTISLLGKHQVENAGMALQMYLLFMEYLELTVNWQVIEESFSHAFIPGRMELLSKQPLVIIDGAHNVPGIERLQANLEEMLAKRSKSSTCYILFSAINTKDVSGMIGLLENIDQAQLTITSFDYESALSVGEIAVNCQQQVNISNNWHDAVTALLNLMNDDDFLIITGSLYFISTIRHQLQDMLAKMNQLLTVN